MTWLTLIAVLVGMLALGGHGDRRPDPRTPPGVDVCLAPRVRVRRP